MRTLLASLDQRADFDEIIDVRTPLEYAEDHLPGAVNAPVLSNEERVIIGTMYRQVSAFDATRLGAALVARNIGHHLETLFADRPRHWRPLIYCWRGGKRSAAMTTWFNMIGWQARQLAGGYKTYRRWVSESLEALPGQFRYIVLTGHTGSGKTRLLQALRQAGAQVLDLESLSCHRGSLLGAMPGSAQPAQKHFETQLVSEMVELDPARPVFIEAESARIGLMYVPKALLVAFHQGDCIEVEASFEDRISFLLEDYGHLFDEPAHFKSLLSRLTLLHGKKTIQHWQELIDENQRARLFGELLERHYDPAYTRSSQQHFTGLANSLRFTFEPNAANSVDQATKLIESYARHRPEAVRPVPHPVDSEEVNI